jgi:hypothetical protein
MTVTGRDSGETVKAPKGQVPAMGIISQAKGQSVMNIADMQYAFQRSGPYGLAFYYFIKQLMEGIQCTRPI